MLRSTVLASLLIIELTGCGRRAPTASPDGVVREWVERMRRLRGDPAEAKAAYQILSKRAQQNLATRAQRHSAASGKAVTPEAMIAPSRFVLRFEPQRYAARTSGTTARVDIVGLLPEHHAQLPCVFEDGGWRVDPALPALPPVQLRPGTTHL